MVSLNAAFFYLHNVGPICFAAIWLASARWVYLDARRRHQGFLKLVPGHRALAILR